ncbi:MAG: hypothetical protein PHV03_09305 [Desulfitobacteriaceae bacterium]|nr:hypothetical protein [Desulfitobacteriaceae bacterium]
MNIGPLLGAAKSFLGNKYTVGATLGGAAGFRQGKNLWKSTPAAHAMQTIEELSFKIKIDDSVLKDSVLNPKNLASMIEKQYPSGRVFLEDFTIHYDPITKNIEFRPTEKFLQDSLEDSGLMKNMKLKLEMILPSVLGMTTIGLGTTALADKGPEAFKKFKEFVTNQKDDEPAKTARMIFEELEKRAVSNELDKIAANIDLNTAITNHFRG